jgi:hypothetical protein
MSISFSEKIKAYKPDVKPITILRYSTNINKYIRDMSLPSTVESLLDKDKVFEYVKNMSDGTRKSYLNSIIVAVKAIAGEDQPVLLEYQKMRDDLNASYFKQRRTGQKSQKEQDNMLTMEELDMVIDELENRIKGLKIHKKTKPSDNDFEQMLQHLILVLYRNYPLRGDYAEMKVTTHQAHKKDNSKDFNYYISNSKPPKFILNSYKTNKTYGSKDIPIDKIDVVKVIRRWLRFLALQDFKTDYLIVDKNGEPFNRNRLAKFVMQSLLKYTGKRTGINMLRKSYLTDKYSGVKDEMEKDADVMGHSVSTQQEIYTRNN